MTKERSPSGHVLVTGNLGYIGRVLTPELFRRGYRVTGMDTGYYEDDCVLYPEDTGVGRQIRMDIRDVERKDFEGVDAVIHLASLSNDPLGELIPGVTEAINYTATVRLAECARDAGVKRFVYASSQSMYGIADLTGELDEDSSEKNPLTAYARAKWMAECEMGRMGNDDFTVTFFRPSTVFGASPALRCDIVYNNLIAGAFTTGVIDIKSDGTPWRPVIHVNDVSDALISGIEAPVERVANQAFNIGIDNGNYTVRQLADTVKTLMPACEIRYSGEHAGDARTYRVSFKKILRELDGYFRPSWDLIRGGNQLIALFNALSFTKENFRGPGCNRLIRIRQLLTTSQLDETLRWTMH
jgi:nucleoside-diphosphate-sugar epimerase